MLGTKSSHPDTPLFVLFCALLVWIPIPLGSMRPWAQGIIEVWIALLMLGWLFLYVKGRVCISPVLYRCRYFFVLLFVWILYLVAQLILGNRIDASNQGLFFLADLHLAIEKFLLSTAYCLLFFLTIAVCNTRQRIKLLMAVIVFSGLFQAVYGSLMTLSGLEYHFFMKKWSYIGVATGTFINRNHYAAYLVMCLAVGIGLMISQLVSGESLNLRGRLRNTFQLLLSPKVRLRLYLVMMVIALVLTRSRMGNTAFFASLFACGGIALLLSRHATRAMVVFLVSIIVIDILIVGAWFGIDKVAERLENTSAIAETRDEVNEYGYEQWQDNFLTGAGLGAFPSTFPQYRGYDIPGLYYHAHNDHLQFAVEVGLFGLVILAFISFSSLLAAIIGQYRRRDPLMRGVSFASMLGITAMLIHATVEFNFQIPANAGMFMVLMALAWVSLFHREIKNYEVRNGNLRGKN